MTYSPALKELCAERIEWEDAGAPEHPYFNRYDGLCHSAFLSGNSVLQAELEAALKADFGDSWVMPFGDCGTYGREFYSDTAHLNKPRRAWCEKVVAS